MSGKFPLYRWLGLLKPLLLWLLLTPPLAAVELRVAVKKGVSSLQVGSSTPAVVRDARGRVVGQIAGMNSFISSAEGGNVAIGQWKSNRLWLEPSGGGFVWIGDGWYRGRVLLVPQGDALTAINYVDLEDYLYSVVGAEAIPSWPLDALKAQAVAARTYALYKRNTSANQLFDLDNTVATQVYKGLNSEYTTTHQAVRETKGEVMTYNGQVILAVFHASSGGHTENVEDIWLSPLPYLRGVVDYDQTSPVFSWTKTVSPSILRGIVGDVGNIRALVPQKTTPRGRIVTMTIVGDRGSRVVSGADLRKVLDLRSTLFRANVSDNGLEIYGRGFGHGLGLSQWGAQYLASNGINYRQILAHYYRNARLARIQTRN
ncbi:MAG: SpoIID/LytB domain-containing protein [Geminocystis sp.]|nr:SpoIID/LytB domain-containing protein [Geminocystis sp.]HIK38444.1 SpoIID/LytB domain-containing protein [Geminocystis sp. M7585_C2015_104]MCS7147789.1 SpoIID/LytB domain-containing protein [Geminocystis sp.]MCX8079191.1 SpoIID/LytB domain-containing protein [Geminocystis sp.]MDW8116637.1 SpoIID/LytB domain-containing protein [Geminocystis sp.]